MQSIKKSEIVRFGNLELLAKQVVEGFITGLHKSPFHGFSVEFAEHRLYNKGESTRHIDWKLYGRTEKLFTKKYEEETNLRCQIVIDSSSSMYFPKDDLADHFNKMEYSIYAAASLMELLRRQRDAVGLTVFNEEIDINTKSKSSATHIRTIYHEMDKLLNSVETEVSSNVVKCLHDIAELTHQRSLVLIFSDMMDTSEGNEELLQALQHLRHRKHEVILFHVHDKKIEFDLDLENRPYQFIDAETGEKMKLSPNQIKEKYRDSVSQWYDEMKLKCGQSKIDFVPTNIRESLEFVLVQYLLKRQKMIR